MFLSCVLLSKNQIFLAKCLLVCGLCCYCASNLGFVEFWVVKMIFFSSCLVYLGLLVIFRLSCKW